MTTETRGIDSYQPAGAGQPIPALIAVPDPARASLFDTVQWLQRNRSELLGTVRSRGAVLLRGLPVTAPSEVAALRDTLFGQVTGPREPFARRDALGYGLYSDLHWSAGQLLCPQHEQSYRLSFPQLLLLACLQPPATGGQSLLADGRQVLSRLPATLAERLRTHGWIMVRHFRDRFGVPWQEAFGATDPGELESTLDRELIGHRWLADGVLRTFRQRAAVVHHPVDGQACWFNHAAFFNEYGLGLDPQERQVLREAFGPTGLTLNTLIGDGTPFTPAEVATIERVYDELTVPVELGAGDLLVLDNIAVAHGRRPYTGRRVVAVAMGDPVSLASCRPTVQPSAGPPVGAGEG